MPAPSKAGTTNSKQSQPAETVKQLVLGIQVCYQPCMVSIIEFAFSPLYKGEGEGDLPLVYCVAE